ncbi:hypothetical protein Herbaro_09200 [Herbaspirillum sp. WKF16]|uniref:hypothetical protein n=1 Tax=Herbaspirillum sp. WKF16 TaxID=3028312 RepID=UPI0023A9BD0F|nr:hypothetical protein [Herbaspirillum sp. WKF16]WDZ97936.1 hypothetical protein Herbaro_09200 [Herbaspirillum sp. WKF16]
MPEIVDGFLVTRTWMQEGETFYPCIDVEMTLPDGRVVRNSRTVRMNGGYARATEAVTAAGEIQVRGVACDADFQRIIIQLDTF